nr:MAG TPA: hypothetical protein [Caudoviricetes sp.]
MYTQISTFVDYTKIQKVRLFFYVSKQNEQWQVVL